MVFEDYQRKVVSYREGISVREDFYCRRTVGRNDFRFRRDRNRRNRKSLKNYAEGFSYVM